MTEPSAVPGEQTDRPEAAWAGTLTALVVDVIMLDTSGAVDHDGARPGPTAPR